MTASSVRKEKDLNRIETVSLSNSDGTLPSARQPRPSATHHSEASPKTDRRKMYSRPPEVVMPAPTPLPGVLLL